MFTDDAIMELPKFDKNGKYQKGEICIKSHLNLMLVPFNSTVGMLHSIVYFIVTDQQRY